MPYAMDGQKRFVDFNLCPSIRVDRFLISTTCAWEHWICSTWKSLTPRLMITMNQEFLSAEQGTTRQRYHHPFHVLDIDWI